MRVQRLEARTGLCGVGICELDLNGRATSSSFSSWATIFPLPSGFCMLDFVETPAIRMTRYCSSFLWRLPCSTRHTWLQSVLAQPQAFPVTLRPLWEQLCCTFHYIQGSPCFFSHSLYVMRRPVVILRLSFSRIACPTVPYTLQPLSLLSSLLPSCLLPCGLSPPRLSRLFCIVISPTPSSLASRSYPLRSLSRANVFCALNNPFVSPIIISAVSFASLKSSTSLEWSLLHRCSPRHRLSALSSLACLVILPSCLSR